MRWGSSKASGSVRPARRVASEKSRGTGAVTLMRLLVTGCENRMVAACSAWRPSSNGPLGGGDGGVGGGCSWGWSRRMGERANGPYSESAMIGSLCVACVCVLCVCVRVCE